jgi:hypothetical protein
MKAIELVVRAVKRFGTSLESFVNSKMPTQIQKKAVISRLLDFEPKKIDFLFEKDVDDRLRERSEILIEESWEFNQEDRVLIRSAIDIWSQTGLVFLSEIMNSLLRPWRGAARSTNTFCRPTNDGRCGFRLRQASLPQFEPPTRKGFAAGSANILAVSIAFLEVQRTIEI